jgi:dienelactone hydrolase
MTRLRESLGDSMPGTDRMTRRSVLGALSAGVAAGVAGGGVRQGTARSQAEQGATLYVDPQLARYDEPLTIEVRGVDPGTEVTLTARATTRNGTVWASFARFEAAADGTVNPARQAPVAGTYEETSQMGLVWSMRPTESDVSIFLPPRDGHVLELAARVDGRTIAKESVTRRLTANQTVVESPDGLVGSLFRPEGEGPYPGVLTLHGSGGSPDTGTAIVLAAHGYAVFAPQYFGSPNPLPDELAEVPVEYLDRCREWMQGLDAVRDGPVGLVGASKGAEYALLGGTTYDWVGSVAAIAPSGLVWAGLTNGRERTSSWTVDGEPVPYVPTAFPTEVVADYLVSWPLGEPVSLRPTYEQPLESASQDRIDEATIPVEEIDGPVTLVAGGSDALWPSVELGTIAADRLRANDHPHSVRFLTYPDAGHGISFPYQPTTGLTAVGGFPPGTGLAFGGTPAGVARAAADAWPQIIETLAEGLR